MKESQTPWKAITAWLHDPSDKEAEAIVTAWLSESPDHIGILKALEDAPLQAGGVGEPYRPDGKKLWNQLVTRISVRRRQSPTITLSILKYSAVAAMLVLAFFAGTRINRSSEVVAEAEPVFSRVMTDPGQRTHVVLPDSTRVWLNSGSELRYPTQFGNAERDVYVSGECYFEVAKNKKCPFVVHTADLKVKVYGTHFNVKENLQRGLSEVTLVEGKVEVLDADSKSLSYLAPGEQLSLRDHRFRVEKQADPDALIAWTKGILEFSNKPFGEVVGYLENWYGVKIHLDQSLENNSYTFKVKTESLREMLYLISEFTPIQYKIEGDEVYISPKKKS